MMKRFCVYLWELVLALSIVTVLLQPATAAACDPWAAKVVSAEGTVEARKAGETGWQAAGLSDTYCPGDVIRTGANSRADVVLVNQSVLRINQSSQITLGAVEEEKRSFIDLLKGAAHFFSRTPKGLEVKTPYTIAGVRGTEFLVTVSDGQTELTVFEGAVLAKNEAGSLMLKSGQSAVAQAGKAPVLRVVAQPRDAVRWALYYPPVVYAPAQGAKKDPGDPRFLIWRASQLLAVGRVDEAKADIDRALSIDPNYSDALALQAIMAVVHNDKAGALKLAQRAVKADPQSATAHIALSYARQADFDLEGARDSLEAAVKADPQNALAWARLAELWSSFGRLDRSLAAAQKAVSLDPNLSRTQTVLGFAYLTQVNTAEAQKAFDKAITLDQADPLPRLGLGLARIRDGDLEAGGSDIEIAASLDPNNALIRSYLGKTYYEQKRTKLDGREFATAKELDPSDPTPWFYDAIRKQTTNRPVEALHDMQKAIALNDNRAVYRSKLMLDSDLAARSSSLARIYNNLGFQQRGLVEGWNSVNTDPTNFSAHRFLADSYSVLPRHEIARVSELLQSQLLQPINITPIQPRLAESNLFLISSQGPSAAGFNTYNPLFNRNGAAVQAGGLWGENSTWSAEGIVSGIYNKLSLSAGYSGFGTDGYRDNNDQDDDIANVFAQYEITYKTSVQAEYRYRKNKRGDVQLRFLEDDFFPNLRQEDKNDTYRFGLRHAFAPNSILLGSFIYQDADYQTDDITDDPFFMERDVFNWTINEDALTGELQYLYRSNLLNLVGGAGYSNIDRTDATRDEISDISMPPPVFLFSIEDQEDTDVDNTNVYLYSYINFPSKVTWTLGVSGDFFKRDIKESDSRDIDTNQFNPKFGITWELLPGTTLRGAVFRTLKRPLVTNQTLEPTQVAGFNQFYDDDNATEAWRYGAALDQKFTDSLFGGVEFAKRDLSVPVEVFDMETFELKLKTLDWDEYFGRAYLYWTACNWLALRAEYQYEEIKRDDTDLIFEFKEVKTHRVPLGITFFHPSGLSAAVKATYYDQKGEFLPSTAAEFVSGSDHFWLVDAAVSYRLPKRYGFITVGVSNLFDESFQYYDIDYKNPAIQPERFAFAKVTLSIP